MQRESIKTVATAECGFDNENLVELEPQKKRRRIRDMRLCIRFFKAQVDEIVMP